MPLDFTVALKKEFIGKTIVVWEKTIEKVEYYDFYFMELESHKKRLEVVVTDIVPNLDYQGKKAKEGYKVYYHAEFVLNGKTHSISIQKIY